MLINGGGARKFLINATFSSMEAQFNLLPADILKNHGVHPVPLGKGSELPGFFISLSK